MRSEAICYEENYNYVVGLLDKKELEGYILTTEEDLFVRWDRFESDGRGATIKKMTETKTEYKDTLNLPQTTLEMRANATKKEPETQKFWEEQNIYAKMTIWN